MSTAPLEDVTTDTGAVIDHLVPREQNPMLDPANALKLAVFCPNVARGTSISFADSLPKASWPESKRLGQAADRAGIDGFIPVARWKNNARTRPQDDRIMEPFTWAAGVSAVTERLSVFATVHMPLFHPLAVAAMTSTVDHISGGRFSINVVAGYNPAQFKMFGVEQRSHDDRYAFADEWLEFLKQIWTAEEPFDFRGTYFDCEGVISKPLPLQRPHPVVMSAGASPEGRRFASKHADVNFVALPSFDELPAIVGRAKQEARDDGFGDVAMFCGGYLVCADTEAEALRRYHYVVRDQIDRKTAQGALDFFKAGGAKSNEVIPQQEHLDRLAAGFNALPLVGTAEQIVERMTAMSAGGLDGIALSFHDYDEGIAAYDEAVRPLLIEAGLRTV